MTFPTPESSCMCACHVGVGTIASACKHCQPPFVTAATTTAPTPERQLDVEKLRRLTPEQLASDFHHNYETLAPHFGYRTRTETAVPWEQVPERNKALMVAVIRALVFEDLNLPAILAALAELEGLQRAAYALSENARPVLDGALAWTIDAAVLQELRQRLAAREAEEENGG